MKFSVSVCELNPLHGGHVRLIKKMKESGDKVALIMSGNFCQRGEAAIVDKYTRARHAVLAGADIVFELPAAFSSSPAELFARGAVKLLDSLPVEKTLFFGTELGEKEDFLSLANATLNESKQFKAALKSRLDNGSPFALARMQALEDTGVDISLMKTPNSVLGLEYVKAILRNGSNMDFQPILRTGAHDDLTIGGEYISAAAVRKAVKDGKKKKIKSYLPKFVYADLPDELPDFSVPSLYSILSATAKDLREVTDCSEGLENRIKISCRASDNLEHLIDRLETRRYTRARISRIITNNMLGITRDFTEKCLKAPLYLKVLAVAEDSVGILSELSACKNKLITRKADGDKLDGVVEQCFTKDVFASDVYSLVTNKKTNEFEMKIVKRDAIG